MPGATWTKPFATRMSVKALPAVCMSTAGQTEPVRSRSSP